jgi:hypothetical protein
MSVPTYPVFGMYGQFSQVVVWLHSLRQGKRLAGLPTAALLIDSSWKPSNPSSFILV